MAQTLTVKQATRFTGKSESTIKRLIREITDDPNHPDRHLISPSHHEVVKRRETKEPYVWKLDESLLTARYEQADSDGSVSSDSSPTQAIESSGDRIITVLEETIDVLKSELGEKNKQIGGLQERLREQNLLTKNLQDQLLLASPAKRKSDTQESEPIIVETPAVTEEGTDRVEDVPVPQKKTKAPSIWHREFHLFGPKRRKE